MKALLLISSVTPYHRGGFYFPMVAGRRHATIVAPLADVSDVHLEQLLGDPNLVVVPLPDAEAYAAASLATAAERITLLRGAAEGDAGGRDHARRFAALAEREGIAAQHHVALDQRAAALDVRQAAIEAREEAHGRAVTATLRSTDAVDQGAIATADRTAAADTPPRALADVVERNRDEAVDHHGAANTPAQHLADEVEAGLVEIVTAPLDEEGLRPDVLVGKAPTKPKRDGGRFTATKE